jgi:hypothetical protein
MSATQTALIGRRRGSSVSEFSSRSIPPNLDLLQIVDEGGGVLVNVDYAGTVHFPAASPTVGSRIAPFYTRRSANETLAQIFADTFTNVGELDILQVINEPGGGIVYWLDYLGVAYTS